MGGDGDADDQNDGDDDGDSSSSTTDTLLPGDPISEIIGSSDNSPSNQQAQAPSDFSPGPDPEGIAGGTNATLDQQSASPSAASWFSSRTDTQLSSFLGAPEDITAASGSDFVTGFAAVQELLLSSLKYSIADGTLQSFAATVAASGVKTLPLKDDAANLTLFVDANGNAIGRGNFTQDGQQIIHTTIGHVNDQGQLIPHVVADYNTATGHFEGRVIGIDGSSVPFSDQNSIPLDAPSFPEGFIPVVNSGSSSTVSITPSLRPERDPTGGEPGMRPSPFPQSGVPIEKTADPRMEKDPGPNWEQQPVTPEQIDNLRDGLVSGATISASDSRPDPGFPSLGVSAVRQGTTLTSAFHEAQNSNLREWVNQVEGNGVEPNYWVEGYLIGGIVSKLFGGAVAALFANFRGASSTVFNAIDAARLGGARTFAPTTILDFSRLAGGTWESEIVRRMEELGFQTTIRQSLGTSLGVRFPDIIVSQNGVRLFIIEAKVGESAYTAMQQAKDFLIWRNYGLPTFLWVEGETPVLAPAIRESHLAIRYTADTLS